MLILDESHHWEDERNIGDPNSNDGWVVHRVKDSQTTWVQLAEALKIDVDKLIKMQLNNDDGDRDKTEKRKNRDKTDVIPEGYPVRLRSISEYTKELSEIKCDLRVEFTATMSIKLKPDIQVTERKLVEEGFRNDWQIIQAIIKILNKEEVDKKSPEFKKKMFRSQLQSYLDLKCREKCFVYVQSVNDANLFLGVAEKLRPGWAKVVTGNMSASERAEIRRKFRLGDIRIIISIRTLLEGVNEPSCGVTILGYETPRKSATFSKHEEARLLGICQRRGRGERRMEGKSDLSYVIVWPAVLRDGEEKLSSEDMENTRGVLDAYVLMYHHHSS